MAIYAYAGYDHPWGPTPTEYFVNEYMHPGAWRKVLEKFPNLNLCLAHFGGAVWEKGPGKSDWIDAIVDLCTAHEGIFTDFSCFDFHNQAARKNFGDFLRQYKDSPIMSRILFGTDWYISQLVISKGAFAPMEYKDYCKNAYTLIKEIDEKLWVRFTMVNPFEFYGLGEEDRIRSMTKGLKDEIKNPYFDGKLNAGAEKILSIGKNIDKIKVEWNL
jgi:hypothetical protein